VPFSSTKTTDRIAQWKQFGTKLCSNIEANSIVIKTSFNSLTTASFNSVIFALGAQNNKSNGLYLLMMAQCNCKTRSWTRQTLGTCPQCAIRCEQENTEIYKHKSLPKTCMSKSVVQFKGTRSVSNNEVGFLYRIPVMLRQQHCWKFGSVMGNVDKLFLRKLWRQNAAFSESFETHQRLYYRAKCVGANWVAMTMDCEWAIRGGGLLGAEQTPICVMRLAVALLQLSHCAACSNIQPDVGTELRVTKHIFVFIWQQCILQCDSVHIPQWENTASLFDFLQ